MTANEALDTFCGLLARVVPTEENTATMNEAWEAVAVLRAVVEDYDRARPLLEAAMQFKNLPSINNWSPLAEAALAYRIGQGKKEGGNG